MLASSRLDHRQNSPFLGTESSTLTVENGVDPDSDGPGDFFLGFQNLLHELEAQGDTINSLPPVWVTSNQSQSDT